MILQPLGDVLVNILDDAIDLTEIVADHLLRFPNAGLLPQIGDIDEGQESPRDGLRLGGRVGIEAGPSNRRVVLLYDSGTGFAH